MGLRIERIHMDDDAIRKVSPLFVEAYGSTSESSVRRLRAVFGGRPESDSIGLVAVDGEKLLGFQSYLKWPWSGDPQRLAFQSGNSVVAAAARGAGVFQALLNYSDEDLEGSFRFGFPVARSFPSFMANGWTTPFGLRWWVKPLFAVGRKSPSFPALRLQDRPLNRVTFAGDSAFEEWRDSVPRSSPIERIAFRDLTGHFEFRRQRRQIRGPFAVPELTLGTVRLDSSDPEAMGLALREIVGHARMQTPQFRLLTFAVNELSRDWARLLSTAGFRETRRTIPFIYKGAVYLDPMPWSRWWAFRGDIDTW